MSVIKITRDNLLSQVINPDKPVLLDFYADWCGPCKMVGPIVAEIAEEYEGKGKVGKVNVDEEPQLAMQFKVTAIPTLFVFKNGEVDGQIVGFAQKDEIVKLF